MMYKLHNIIKKYTSNNNVAIIMDFFDKNNINNLKFIEENTIPLLFFYKKNQYGGKDDSVFIDVYLDKNKYKIRLYKYTEKDDKNYKTINFIKIDSIIKDDGEFSNADHCAILIIDTKINESNIQSINNYKDCIKCYYEKNKMYKIGDILIQVMIYMSINKGMKNINLHDNSNFKCNNYDIPLIILRTMTHGKPLYTKYGFLPLNHNEHGDDEYKNNELQIYEDNKKLFKSEPKMTKKELLSIIFYKKFDKNKDKSLLYYINNILIPRLTDKNNLIVDFLNNIINDSLNNQKEKDSNLDKNELSKLKNYKMHLPACELLQNISKTIFFKCGYFDYLHKKFILNLENKKIIQYYKNHMKLKIN